MAWTEHSSAGTSLHPEDRFMTQAAWKNPSIPWEGVLSQEGPQVIIYLFSFTVIFHTGVSENSVPLNPMANDHYPY